MRSSTPCDRDPALRPHAAPPRRGSFIALATSLLAAALPSAADAATADRAAH
jgi:hypothetical protein